MNNTKEILSLTHQHVKDRSFKQSLIKAVMSNNWNSARIISESLSEKFPYNKEYKKIDNLITNEC